MAKRNTLKLQLSGFEELITKLDELGGNIETVVEDALQQAGETIGDDTIEAIGKGNLPAQGIYSGGETEKSVIKNPQVEWEGRMAVIGVGFDYSKPGAGGVLITGTPRMKPDQALKKIYRSKKYMNQIQNDMKDIVNDEIERCMGG